MVKVILNKLWDAVRPKSLDERLDELFERWTKALKKHCKDQGYAFIPLYLHEGDLPEFAKYVNGAIEEHARKDLPHAQFLGNRSLKPEDNVEIGGNFGLYMKKYFFYYFFYNLSKISY